MSVKVRYIKDSIGTVMKSIESEGLMSALLAGGIVIRDAAVINIGKTFKNTHGSKGLARIIVERAKLSQTKAVVHVGPTVVYGRIQELGGVIKPIKKKLLSWVDENGVRIFAKMVTLPARPYLRPALDDNIKKIQQMIGTKVSSNITQATK